MQNTRRITSHVNAIRRSVNGCCTLVILQVWQTKSIRVIPRISMHETKPNCACHKLCSGWIKTGTYPRGKNCDRSVDMPPNMCSSVSGCCNICSCTTHAPRHLVMNLIGVGTAHDLEVSSMVHMFFTVEGVWYATVPLSVSIIIEHTLCANSPTDEHSLCTSNLHKITKST